MSKLSIGALICFSLATICSALHASCAMTITVKDEKTSSMNESLIEQVEQRNGYNNSCVYYSEGL